MVLKIKCASHCITYFVSLVYHFENQGDILTKSCIESNSTNVDLPLALFCICDMTSSFSFQFFGVSLWTPRPRPLSLVRQRLTDEGQVDVYPFDLIRDVKHRTVGDWRHRISRFNKTRARRGVTCRLERKYLPRATMSYLSRSKANHSQASITSLTGCWRKFVTLRSML